MSWTSGISSLIFCTNCFADAVSPRMISESTFSLFHFSMKLSSCACAAVVSVPVIASTRVRAARDLELLQLGFHRRLDAALVVVGGEHGNGLALQRALVAQQRHDHVQAALGRDVRTEQQPGWGLVDPGLRQAVGDQHPVLVACHAELGIPGEVDEHAHDRERVVVLRRGGADPERARLRARDRAVGLEDRLDLAAVDAAGVVDVLEVRAVDLVLVEADVVDEVLDALEVDERHDDLDRVRGDAGRGTTCVARLRGRRLRARRRFRRGAVVVVTPAGRQQHRPNHGQHQHASHRPPPCVGASLAAFGAEWRPPPFGGAYASATRSRRSSLQ